MTRERPPVDHVPPETVLALIGEVAWPPGRWREDDVAEEEPTMSPIEQLMREAFEAGLVPEDVYRNALRFMEGSA